MQARDEVIPAYLLLALPHRRAPRDPLADLEGTLRTTRAWPIVPLLLAIACLGARSARSPGEYEAKLSR